MQKHKARLTVAGDGTFSYLAADGKSGWNGLNFSADVCGRLVAARLRQKKATPGGCVAWFDYAQNVTERVTFSVLTRPQALMVERVFRNEGEFSASIGEVRTGLARERSGLLLEGASPASLRVIHVSNLRESARRSSHSVGPFVCPLPERSRLIGDSEGFPFPVLAIGDRRGRCLLEGSLQQDVFTQMWRIRAEYDPRWTHSLLAEYEAIARDGRAQAVALQPGEERRLGSLFYQIKEDGDLQDLYDDYLAELNRRYELHGQKSPLLDASVYCTWNYTFFEKISEDILRRQCAFIAKRLPGVKHFLIDDGYQHLTNTPTYDFGKWYPDPDANIDRSRFPHGMKAVADMIRSYGLEPALWWSPALARRNQLVAEHPEWLCPDGEGNSWSMDTGLWRKAALDFSVKEARDFVEFALETIFVKWGFTGMKLDFCAYPFDCKDIRLRHGEGMRWWNWFLETIAKFIPPRGIFQICGSGPYGNPFLARWCDNHRVGGDIGKGDWETHVAVSSSPLPLLAVPGRSTMLMDVDSAGINHDLGDDENLSRLNWCFVTQGVMGIGGDLTRLSRKQLGWLQKITSNADRGHKVRCPDRRAFTGTPLPDALYVDYPARSLTGKSGVRKHVAFFNWEDSAQTVGYSLDALGISPRDTIQDFWSGRPVRPEQGQLVARLNRRASRLFAVHAGG